MRRVIAGSRLASLCTASRHVTDAKTIRSPHPFEQFASTTNLEYLESSMTASEPNPTFQSIFDNIATASADDVLVRSYQRPETQDLKSTTVTEKERVDNMRLVWMVRAYEKFGHHIAKLDPLGMYEADLNYSVPDCLSPERFGFTADDMERQFFVEFSSSYGSSFQSFVTHESKPLKLREIIEKLKALHCTSIGFEFMSSGYGKIRDWFRDEIKKSSTPLTNEDRKEILADVVKACGFEGFLHKKYATHKRFGLDGAEALIPAMNAALNEASGTGVEAVTIGMPHRGRLNVLVNVCGKNIVKIFNEFEGKTSIEELATRGDVKYHLGMEKEVTLANGKKVFINLLANPSHLEAINPLVIGKTRARQQYTQDKDYTKNMPILLHGDAAFAGQGPCYEVMGLAELENFNVGGTLHIVVNNQIGFTTDPHQSRSTPYCTDLSRICNAPVLHVNGDDVDAVVKAARIAARFRQRFKRDVIIDLVCYRRYGHNETDAPQFTQPLMYKAIEKQPVLVDVFGKKLVAQGVLSQAELDLHRRAYETTLSEKFHEAQKANGFVKVVEANSSRYSNQVELQSLRETGLPLESLKDMGKKITTVPQNFTAHPIVRRTYEARNKAVESGEGVEWCLAEALAFGASSLEGIHVRLTGQDVERGTFTQRHAVMTDQTNNVKHQTLSHLAKVQAPVIISNSSLSEFGVCGFEAGYSMENPKSLVMWEAQFGDFCNGAQVIFDQFLASAESKWIRQCGLVISLPHGYSGAGPEHSSARIERFLQLSDDADHVPADLFKNDAAVMLEARIAEGNWQVCYPSTPANYYHMLRRQTHRGFRKPLIFFFSKARLRAPNVSSLSEMAVGTRFQPVIDTARSESATTVRKVVFCSGQIESIVADARAKVQAASGDATKHDDVVLVKLEQIAPFPWEQVAEVMDRYETRGPGGVAPVFTWLQEEPKNMGCWDFVRPRLQRLLVHKGLLKQGERLPYIGRVAAASPATGYTSVHKDEEKTIVDQVLA